jgi:hypothetical protein
MIISIYLYDETSLFADVGAQAKFASGIRDCTQVLQELVGITSHLLFIFCLLSNDFGRLSSLDTP